MWKLTEEDITALKSEPILGKANGLLKLLFVVQELLTDSESEQDLDFRKFAVKKMTQIFDEFGIKECEQYLRIAIDYQFIIKKTNQSNDSKTKYVLNCDNKMNVTHDWFCFECDLLVDKRSKQLLKCSECWRVFHIKCIHAYKLVDTYVCSYCLRLNEDKEGFIGLQRVDKRKLNVLIGYLLSFVKKQMKESYNSLKVNLNGLKETMIVFKEMDLKKMEEKALLDKYNNLMEFENDFYLFMHNLAITTTDLTQQLLTSFSNYKEYFNKELRELRLCVDCYDRSNDKQLQKLNKDWFCEPCRPPHRLLFVKVKHFPHWPAKLLHDYGDDHYNVRFFDKGLKRMDVKSSDTFPIDDQNILNACQKNVKLVEPLKMLKKYNDNLNLNRDDLMPDIRDMSIDKTLIDKTSDQKVQKVQEIIDSVVNAVYDDNRVKKVKKSNKSSNIKESKIGRHSFTIIQSNTSNSDNDNSVDEVKVPLLIVTDPPTDSITDTTTDTTTDPPEVAKSLKRKRTSIPRKRKSKRNSTINRKLDKQLSNLLNESCVQSKPTDSQINNNITEEIETELSQQSINEKSDTTIVSEESTYLSTIGDISSTDISKAEPKTDITLSQMPQISNDCQTDVQIVPQLQTNMFSNETNDSLKTECNGINVKKNVNEEMIIKEELEDKSQEFSKQVSDLINELLGSKEILDSNPVKPKIICLQYYYNLLMKANDEKLIQIKKKSWCAVCQKKANFFCCVRFYCSEECQTNDWRNGHSSQCLTRIETNQN